MTTQTKQAWTPGPWKYKEIVANRLNMIEGEGPSWYVIHNVQDGHGLAQTFSTYEHIGESEANARLISKAPAMAELLHEAMTSAMIPRDWSERVKRLLADLEAV